MEPVASKTSVRSMFVTEVIYVVYDHHITTSLASCPEWQIRAPGSSNMRISRTSRLLDVRSVGCESFAPVPGIGNSRHFLDVARLRRKGSSMGTYTPVRSHDLGHPLLWNNSHFESRLVLKIMRPGEPWVLVSKYSRTRLRSTVRLFLLSGFGKEISVSKDLHGCHAVHQVRHAKIFWKVKQITSYLLRKLHERS